MYGRFNPENPFFYVDDQWLANLGVGDSRVFRVKPGQHTITSREPFAFNPGRESGKLVFEAKAGEKYYVRYSKEFGSAIPAGNTVVFTSNATLSMSTKNMYVIRE